MSNSPPNYTDLPQVYTDPDANLPQAVPVANLPQAPIESAYRYAATDDYPEPLHTPNPDDNYRPSHTVGDASVASFLVIGAIVGGAVGSTLAKQSSTSDDSPSATTSGTPSATSQASSILRHSKIASVNWTDSDDHSRYFIFYQNQSKDIIASFWDSQNTTWETRSISASLRKADADFEVLPGTPITAVAWEIGTNNPDKDSQWTHHGLGYDRFINTGARSNIAAWRPNGGDPDDLPIVLLYQNDENQLVYSRSNNHWLGKPMGSASVVNASGLAISNLAANSNASDPLWRFYYDSSSTMRSILMEADLSTWDTSKNALGSISSSSHSNFAAVCYGRNDVVVADIQNEGAIVARYWDVELKWIPQETPTFLDTPNGIKASEGFTAISGHSEQRMYGIVDRQVNTTYVSEG
ncbi:hypothetical protein G7Z17_g3469 [Cylindrodendrum hubeiense]|uniref:Fucose-specific lectin n=1 Tax=Cylindrodendrum hubeiense TaxID=595255 RepID=A0A9P5LAS9_9HYPO|nr:hypothetical protein G7Z17_g3469 [Cylindrodendrum hubeiense]